MDLRPVAVYRRAVLGPIAPAERHCGPEAGSALAESCLGITSLKVSFLIFPSHGSHDQICAKQHV